jgi:F-type H+-transporting ATPase subunit b
MAQKVTATTAQPEPGAHGKAFPPLDPNTFAPKLFWLALTFGVLYLLMKRYALPRVGGAIEDRRKRIERDLAQAEKLKVETEQALATYEQALGEARAKASAVAKGMRDTLAAEVDKERTKVEAQIVAKLNEAEARIAQSKAKAMAGVSEIAADTAADIVAKLLGKAVTRDEVQKALVRRAAE